MKRYSDATLLGLSKKELLRHLRCAEHNRDVMEAALNQQYENVKDWEPVKHGEWLSRSSVDLATFVRCSVCDNSVFNGKFEYCPHCGAKMDLEAKND